MIARLIVLLKTRALQSVIFSISMVSLFLFCYSSGYYLLLSSHAFNFYFSSTVFFSLFTHTLERKYVFLICNGILAFLAKSMRFGVQKDTRNPYRSSLDLKSSSVTFSDSVQPWLSDTVSVSDPVERKVLESQEMRNPLLGNPINPKPFPVQSLVPVQFWLPDASSASNPVEAAVMEPHKGEILDEEEEEEEELQMEERYGAEKEEQQQQQLMTTDEREQEGEEGDEESPVVGVASEELLSAEELNKKFEEFIRKMKEEIRIEEQTQLIAV